MKKKGKPDRKKTQIDGGKAGEAGWAKAGRRERTGTTWIRKSSCCCCNTKQGGVFRGGDFSQEFVTYFNINNSQMLKSDIKDS